MPARWHPFAAVGAPTGSPAVPPRWLGALPTSSRTPIAERPAAEEIPRRVLDATALQGLAHPLRVQLADQLSLHGPATATQLAARLNESSGATSYHLRQLEKYGFVEEDPSRGTGRERWWRRVPGRITIEGHTLSEETPATREATKLVLNEFSRAKQARVQHWRDNYERWPRAWADNSYESSNHLRLTATEFARLGHEMDTLLSRWVERTRDREGTDVVDVEVQWYSFPVGEPPADD
jgi:DNA-binding transcriptional ArsR family regulator